MGLTTYFQFHIYVGKVCFFTQIRFSKEAILIGMVVRCYIRPLINRY